LFSDKYDFTNTPKGGVIFMPISQTNLYVTHPQTPDCLA
jgi:hypothetical protein